MSAEKLNHQVQVRSQSYRFVFPQHHLFKGALATMAPQPRVFIDFSIAEAPLGRVIVSSPPQSDIFIANAN